VVEQPQLSALTNCQVRRYFGKHDARVFPIVCRRRVEKLKEVHFNQPQSELVQHVTSLEAYFRATPPTSIKQAQSAIETLTGIKRSETQVREFLKKTPFALPESRHDSRQS
jgi:hypothetical protein